MSDHPQPSSIAEEEHHIRHLTELSVEERELYWLHNVYKGDKVPQLTVRAVLMGSALGALMSLSNLYVGLKTGWALGVAIAACILSFSICRVLGIRMGLLENNAMQSTASAAGYSTGGTMVSGVAAYLMLTGHHMPWPVLAGWTFFLACLGVFMAIPMKRQMIDVEQLRFPSGVAAAKTLRSLHSEGDEAVAKARSLGFAGLFAAIWKFIVEWRKIEINFPGTLAGYPLAKWTIAFDPNLVMVAAGAIIGWKVAWSMFLGAIINYCFLAPKMVEIGAIHGDKLGYREIVSWSTWGGTSIMVASSLFMFALQWRTVLRAMSGLTALFGGGPKEASELDAVEVPTSWFAIGVTLSGLGCVAMLVEFFGTNPLVAVASVILSFVLALVACRATGESDITPMGAMGKVAQLTFGILVPSNMITNLMTAGVTAGAASSSADLLTDLKSGYLLGANPRKQFIAQFMGIFAGCLVVVPAFYILVPTASDLGGDRWPAPAAQVWKKVAELLSQGFHALHPTAQWSLLIGALIGLALPILDMTLPKPLRAFVPSATGVGLAFVIPFFNSLSMFLGAFLALVLTRYNKFVADRYIVAVASGIIAGESLMGIGVALAQAAGYMK